MVPTGRTRSTGDKLKHKKFHINMSNNFYCKGDRALKKKLPTGAVESPSLEIQNLPGHFSVEFTLAGRLDP